MWYRWATISIHALREEGDADLPPDHYYRTISIHALREEGDDKHALVIKLLKIFLSTPSARRATARIRAAKRRRMISIHALREEGDLDRYVDQLDLLISIHALREEGDVV